jgi:hypothetical protein
MGTRRGIATKSGLRVSTPRPDLASICPYRSVETLTSLVSPGPDAHTVHTGSAYGLRAVHPRPLVERLIQRAMPTLKPPRFGLPMPEPK